MTIHQGRSYLAIPGPSVVPDKVLRAMHRAAPNIYHKTLFAQVEQLQADLKYVARTKGDVAIYIGNGHAAWEAAIANTLSADSSVLVLCSGHFGAGWGVMARKMGVNVQTLDFGKSDPAAPAKVAQYLSQDKDHKIKAVLVCHVDTSTSIKSDIAALRQALNDADHPALLMVDCIASLGCDRFEMDAWGVDVMVAACQKGLMTPPGTAFVFFNARAAAAREKVPQVSGYWDWKPRVAPNQFSDFFCGTAPTHHLFGLQAALEMVKEETIEHIWQRHETIANAVWAAFDAWSAQGPLRMNVKTPAHRSHAVTALCLEAPMGTKLREWCADYMGLTLGIGIGMAPPNDPAWHGFFRLGHMGHVNGQMIMGALGTIEAGLCALKIPHGASGLERAAKALHPPSP